MVIRNPLVPYPVTCCAAAPAIGLGLSAVSTVAGISQQSQQASAQRRAIEAQNISARQQADLMESRLQFSRDAAQQQYLRERTILDRQNDNAKLQLEKVRIQTEMQERQQGLELRQAEASADQRVAQLLSAAAQQETQGSVANAQTFRQLAQVFLGNEAEANQVMQLAAVSNLRGGTFDRLAREFEQRDIQARQEAITTTNTASRVSGINAENIRTQADLERQTQGVMLDLYRGQLERQRQLNDFTLERMPGILETQHRRNQVALRADRDTQIANLQLQSQANQQNLQSTLGANRAQMSAIPGPNILGGLASIGGSIFNFTQQQSMMPGGTGTFSGQPVRNLPPSFIEPVMQTQYGLLDGRI